ncbi:transcriptional repressor LexA [Methylocaldum szegediense]|uniref:LexA repressor n=1 Tax=Methylocaldum szegediense TaxID=73780 RepID=A0ABM9HVR7_9GAMM|nr:transcriptional repressor LexA [Methylocaldum szegediense]CAI8718844.1 DNA-binding transcriptional repressor LexA [Methylocaldum szegediense]
MKSITPRQQEILDHIRQTLRQSGVPPTIAEIADALGIKSTNAVRGHLQALARKGVIELMPSLARGIRLLEHRILDDALPVIGRVAAGRPVLTEAHIEKYCRLGPELFQGKADYLLRVRGLSMRDAGILEGDLLAVQRTNQARSGQIVIARIGDEITVKRLRLEGSMAYLEPANPDFETLSIDLERQELCIEGVVVGLIRSEWI